ncbi:MAG: hypothetical protein R3176_06390 [Woeseiaceae bacterium]|nr:hypothetical protein [Woeseiaceae bacterium]
MTGHDVASGARSGRRWRIAYWGGAALLLLAPLVAMRFTDEVAWTAFDFAFAAGLFAVVGGVFELAVKLTPDSAYRAAVAVALAAMFLLVWINGAVGIIGGEDNPANLMYGGVLAVGVTGAFVARFRPGGMVYAMAAAGVAQVGVAVIAIVASLGPDVPKWPWDVVGLTVFFTVLWALAAWLFGTSRDRADDGPIA